MDRREEQKAAIEAADFMARWAKTNFDSARDKNALGMANGVLALEEAFRDVDPDMLSTREPYTPRRGANSLPAEISNEAFRRLTPPDALRLRFRWR